MDLKIGTSYQNTSCQVKAWISSRHDLTDTGNTGCSANCPRVRDNTEELVDRGNKPTDQNTRTRRYEEDMKMDVYMNDDMKMDVYMNDDMKMDVYDMDI